MIAREPEKLAAIEKQINEVKECGYGKVEIIITNGQITDAKLTVGDHWPVVSPEELAKREQVLTVIMPL